MCFKKFLFAKYVLREPNTPRAQFLNFSFLLVSRQHPDELPARLVCSRHLCWWTIPSGEWGGCSQGWLESCSLNTVRVQGDEGEDRCEERGSRLRGVAVTNLLWGGLCHDPRQQRLLGNELLHSPGDLWGRGFLVTCPKIRLSTLRRAIQNWWTSMQVGIVILGRHPKTLSNHYRKHPSTAIAFPHPRPLVNMYPTHPTPLTPYHPDPDVGSYQDETWYGSGSSWLKVICAYFMLILSLKMVWGSGLAHLSYTLWNYVIFRTLGILFLLISSAGVSMGHPPGDQLGDARIWSSWYLHHWKRVQVAAECLSWGENCCRLLTTLCFSRWVGGWVDKNSWLPFTCFVAATALGTLMIFRGFTTTSIISTRKVFFLKSFFLHYR